MEIELLPIETPVLLVKDFFDSYEKELMENELKFLIKPHKLLPPEQTSAATYENGVRKKRGMGRFLEDIYMDKACSEILQINRKYFTLEFAEQIEKYSKHFRYLRTSSRSSTLLNYFEGNDHYKAHYDSCVLTITTYFWKLPKRFEGGELIFTDYNYKTDVSPWDLLVFPSYLLHEVTPLKLLDKTQDEDLPGRVSLSTFVSCG